MQFETQRLLIRPWNPTLDARHALDIYGDRRVMAWVDDGSRDLSIRQVQVRLQRYADERTENIIESWAVEQKDIGRVIGSVLLVQLPDLKNKKPTANSWAALKQDAQPLADTEYPDGISTQYIEIGWHFRPASWGFGYATEAAQRICRHAFEDLNLPLLLAVSAPENKRSMHVAERLGMRQEGLTTRYYGGQPLALYKLSAPDFKDSNPSDSDPSDSEIDGEHSIKAHSQSK